MILDIIKYPASLLREKCAPVQVTDTSIKNCTVSQNDYGIQIASSTIFTITDCILDQNSYANAILSEGGMGNIIHNEFTNGGSVGLQFLNVDYVNITLNRFQNNLGYAIYLDPNSMWNWIHHNAFISNNLAMGTSQAYDGTMSLNMWDDPWSMEGNYWDDHTGPGNYTLDGTYKVNDTYPLGSVPPGVIPEYQQLSFLILLLPIVFVSVLVFRKKKK